MLVLATPPEHARLLKGAPSVFIILAGGQVKSRHKYEEEAGYERHLCSRMRELAVLIYKMLVGPEGFEPTATWL